MVKRGGQLSVGNFKSMIDNTYAKKPDTNINGFVLDSQLSNKRAKVYHDPNTGQTVVSHRGTSGISDWANNVQYMLGNYDKTARYRAGKRTQDAVYAKYGSENTSTIGHSQGAVLARKLGGDSKEIISLNGANRGEKARANEFNVKSKTDVVSAFVKAKDRDIVIKSDNPLNILNEHSTNILDRLDQNEMIGQGLRRPNRWIEHVKSYSKKHGVTYSTALKDPACKTAYKKINP